MPAKKSPKSAAARSKSRPARQLAIGIDMGGGSVKIGVCDGGQLLFHADALETAKYSGANALIAAMVAEIRALKSASPSIAAVGIGVPGFTNVNTGMVAALTNVPGWKDVPLNKILTQGTGIPSFAENDANAMAYAEFMHGAGKGSLNMVGVTLGTGVGGGLVLDGKLYRGSFFGAGEIGQMSIDFRGKPATYGNTGALEEYVGRREVTARALELYQNAGQHREAENCTPAKLAQAAKEGDGIALQVWDEFTTQLACGLANCVWLLNPDTIVIGGGISKAGKILFDPLKKKLHGQLHKTFKANLKLVPAHFENDAGIIGSAAVALDRLRSS